MFPKCARCPQSLLAGLESVGAPMRAAALAAVRIWQGPQRAQARQPSRARWDAHLRNTRGQHRQFHWTLTRDMDASSLTKPLQRSGCLLRWLMCYPRKVGAGRHTVAAWQSVVTARSGLLPPLRHFGPVGPGHELDGAFPFRLQPRISLMVSSLVPLRVRADSAKTIAWPLEAAEGLSTRGMEKSTGT